MSPNRASPVASPAADVASDGGELLNWFGDALDDRIAEIVKEVLDGLLDERETARRRWWVLAVAGVLLGATAMLVRGPLGWAIWGAGVCAVAGWGWAGQYARRGRGGSRDAR